MYLSCILPPQLEEETTDGSGSDDDSYQDEEDDNVVSFRDSELTQSAQYRDEMEGEGDIGLGYDPRQRLDESEL